MIQITQLKLPVNHTEADIRKRIIKELDLGRIYKDMPDFSYKILRKSIDARKKPEIYYIYSVAVDLLSNKKLNYNQDANINNDEKNQSRPKANNKEKEQNNCVILEGKILKKCKNKNVCIYEPKQYIMRTGVLNRKEDISRPIIVGEGPCGLFAGLILAEAGANPIIIERGESVDDRVTKVEKFWQDGEIDPETNVQYGEGGAGTFSDGKLNTLVKDKTGKNQFVLDTFVKYGADEKCAYDAKPHIGTDVLRNVVANIRNRIIECGGQVINNCKMTDLVIENGRVRRIIIDNMNNKEVSLYGISESKVYDNKVLQPGKNEIPAESVILALGHSARDTFEMLYEKEFDIEQKNFAIGIRIQHPQKKIDDSQYGVGHSDKLPPSPYKVTNHTSNGRDVFSFCMCPGGYVVNASSKNGYLCVNGMSYSDRGSENANSALIVAIDRKDFLDDHPLAGMYLQEKLEKLAFDLGNGKIPVQLFGDYEKGMISAGFGDVNPVFKGETEFVNLRDIFPEEINKAIIESIHKFGYTIEGFNDSDVIIAAIESRTSSPIRIKRDDNYESSVKGVYPAGEGAGYAGGIMSAAMDGIRVADIVIDKYLTKCD